MSGIYTRISWYPYPRALALVATCIAGHLRGTGRRCAIALTMPWRQRCGTSLGKSRQTCIPGTAMNSPIGVPSQRQPVASSPVGNRVRRIKPYFSKPAAGSRNAGPSWASGYTGSSRLCGLGIDPTRRASCCPATPPLERAWCRLLCLWCLARAQRQRLLRCCTSHNAHRTGTRGERGASGALPCPPATPHKTREPQAQQGNGRRFGHNY